MTNAHLFRESRLSITCLLTPTGPKILVYFVRRYCSKVAGDPRMARLQLQGEWKLWAGFAAIFILIASYLYMVSRPPMEGGEYLWRVDKVLGSKDFSLRSLGNIIRFRLIGMRVPPSQEQPARDYLTKTLENQWVRIKIIREDPQGVKEGFLYLSGEDLIARMIRQGLAEIDRDERSFDVRPYIELEQEAKRERKGLWSQAPQGAK